MPTYTYLCPDHGSFDSIVRLSQRNEETPCPQCEKGSKRAGLDNYKPKNFEKAHGWHMLGIESINIMSCGPVAVLPLEGLTDEQQADIRKYVAALNDHIEANPDADHDAFLTEYLANEKRREETL